MWPDIGLEMILPSAFLQADKLQAELFLIHIPEMFFLSSLEMSDAGHWKRENIWFNPPKGTYQSFCAVFYAASRPFIQLKKSLCKLLHFIFVGFVLFLNQECSFCSFSCKASQGHFPGWDGQGTVPPRNLILKNSCSPAQTKLILHGK